MEYQFFKNKKVIFLNWFGEPTEEPQQTHSKGDCQEHDKQDCS